MSTISAPTRRSLIATTAAVVGTASLLPVSAQRVPLDPLTDLA
jgi:hypothetical protein